jgi:hypothetical protein
MRIASFKLMVAGVVLASGLAACSAVAAGSSAGLATEPSPSASPLAPSVSPSPSMSVKPSPSKKPTPKPTATLKRTASTGGDIPKVKPSPSASPSPGFPTKGAGTFAIASGGTDVVGTGVTLVQYRVEVETGIDWGTIPAWSPDRFAGVVDQVYANPRGWIASAEHPITNAAESMTDASWSFQRVSGSSYSVRIRLATPDTVDRLCGAVGVQTYGQYSCRYGSTLMINLRRWLYGVQGFGDIDSYRNMVLDHEMGHFLGFDHMLCPGAGQPAPVMQTQTIALNGCTPNPYPFSAEGEFIVGPWTSSS